MERIYRKDITLTFVFRLNETKSEGVMGGESEGKKGGRDKMKRCIFGAVELVDGYNYIAGFVP